MQSLTTRRFRELLEVAPASVREKANAAYQLWAENPSHPSLRFKKVHATLPVYSVRIDLDWRAVGVLRESQMMWFWVGPHSEYEKLLTKI
ncbi:MAG: hypothetical protein IPP91_17025 [Betaproteobacteria bacterium]|nr:hypothetical protein [Betaproteobacteria bacterium]